jgi:hypothetical protein
LALVEEAEIPPAMTGLAQARLAQATPGRNGLKHAPVEWNRRLVMAGLVPAIHALRHAPKTWMRGTSPRMTAMQCEWNTLRPSRARNPPFRNSRSRRVALTSIRRANFAFDLHPGGGPLL